MSRGGKLVKNTLILSIGTFFPKLVSIITLPVLTAHLTKVEYGTYDLIVTLVSLLLPILTLQIQSAAFRFLIDARDNKKDINKIISNIIVFTVLLSVIALIILFFFLPGMNSLLKLLVCIYYFIDIIYIMFQQITRGLSFNFYYSISSIILSCINLALIVLLVGWQSFGLSGVLISLIVAYSVGTLFLIIKIRKKWEFDFSLVSMKNTKELLSYSWPMVFNNLSSWILRLSDRLVITSFLGVEANAVYAVANKIPNLLSMVQSTFSMAWQENATMVSKDEDASSYYTSMFDNVFCIVASFTGILIASTPILFTLLIKGDYNDAYNQMPLLFIGMMFCCLSSFQGGIYVAYMKTKQVGITTIVAAICNLVIDLVLVKHLGITAASIATLVSYLLLFIYRMIDIQKIVTIKYNYKKILPIVLVLIVMSIICFKNTLWLNILNIFISIILMLILEYKMIRFVIDKVKMKKQA